MFIFNLHVIKMNQSSFHQLQMGLIGVLGFRFLCCFFLGVLPAHDWMNLSDLSHFLFCSWSLLVETGEILDPV